jgi:oxaloacetate decarboxylase (Na+ extruding) subunit gamma
MTEMLSQGMNLTLFGMGTVLVFLSLLILVTQGMSAILLRFEEHSVAQDSNSGARYVQPQITQQQGQPNLPDVRTHAIIQAAIDQYRARH